MPQLDSGSNVRAGGTAAQRVSPPPTPVPTQVAMPAAESLATPLAAQSRRAISAPQLAALQGAAGNRAVQRLMTGPRHAQRPHPAHAGAPRPHTGSLTHEHSAPSMRDGAAAPQTDLTDGASVQDAAEMETSSSDLQRQTPRIGEPPAPIRGMRVVQRAPAKSDQTANIATLTTLRANADRRFQLATDYAKGTMAVGDTVKTKLTVLSNTYTTGYNVFRDTLNKAQQQAQNQQTWTDIAVGVVCGAAAGLLAAFVLPSTAAGWFSLTMAEAGTAALSSAGQGVLSGGVAALASNMTSVEGKNISSEGLQPAFQELAMWKKVAEIYRSGLEVTPMVQALHQVSGSLADRIGDLRVYQAGGKTDLTEDKIKTLMSGLTAPDAQLNEMQTQLYAKLVELQNLLQAANNINTDKTATSMERDIWKMWMSTLPMNSKILDIDAIEDHIGPKGLKIIDFGLYTTVADQNDAIDKARTETNLMKAEATQSLVPENPAGNLRVRTLN